MVDWTIYLYGFVLVAVSSNVRDFLSLMLLIPPFGALRVQVNTTFLLFCSSFRDIMKISQFKYNQFELREVNQLIYYLAIVSFAHNSSVVWTKLSFLCSQSMFSLRLSMQVQFGDQNLADTVWPCISVWMRSCSKNCQYFYVWISLNAFFFANPWWWANLKHWNMRRAFICKLYLFSEQFLDEWPQTEKAEHFPWILFYWISLLQFFFGFYHFSAENKKYRFSREMLFRAYSLPYVTHQAIQHAFLTDSQFVNYECQTRVNNKQTVM